MSAAMKRTVLLTACLFSIAVGCSADATLRSADGSIILDDFSCPSCEIVAESIAFLGHPDDTVSLGQENVPAMDSRGRFYVADRTGGAVLVFDPQGRLMSTFGRGGRGPGEFARVSRIYVGAGDTLYIVGSGTIHTVSPDYAHLGQVSSTSGTSSSPWNALLYDGRILSRSGEKQFTLVDPRTAATTTVDLEGVDSVRCARCADRVFNRGIDSASIWSIPQGLYRFDHHSLDGSHLGSFVREVSWFPPPDEKGMLHEESGGIVEELARPQVFGVHQDSDGLVWSHVIQLENIESLPKDLDEDRPQDMFRILSHMVTHLEAIDPGAEQLVNGIKLKGLALSISGDVVGQLVMDEAGDWSWKIVRVRLKR